jgi:hypothetical protein
MTTTEKLAEIKRRYPTITDAQAIEMMNMLDWFVANTNELKALYVKFTLETGCVVPFTVFKITMWEEVGRLNTALSN